MCMMSFTPVGGGGFVGWGVDGGGGGLGWVGGEGNDGGGWLGGVRGGVGFHKRRNHNYSESFFHLHFLLQNYIPLNEFLFESWLDRMNTFSLVCRVRTGVSVAQMFACDV